VAFVATLKNGPGGIKPSQNTGLWLATPTGSALLLRTGDSILINGASLTVSSIGALASVPGAGGQGHGNAHGRVSVLLNFTGHGQAIIRYDGFAKTFDLIAVTNDAGFVSLGLPAQSADDLFTAFPASVMNDPGVKRPGIYKTAAGPNWELVAGKGDELATFGNFVSFGSPVVNGAGDVAFSATLAGGSSRAPATKDVVWVQSGEPRVIAQLGAVPPGYDAGARFATFLSLALPDGGPGPVFTAKVTLPTGTTSIGLWAADAAGNVALLLRTGQFAPGQISGKIITGLAVLPTVAGSYAQTRSYNDAGKVVVSVTYSDRSSEIATLTLPQSF
jgi:hypothetical protein